MVTAKKGQGERSPQPVGNEEATSNANAEPQDQPQGMALRRRCKPPKRLFTDEYGADDGAVGAKRRRAPAAPQQKGGGPPRGGSAVEPGVPEEVLAAQALCGLMSVAPIDSRALNHSIRPDAHVQQQQPSTDRRAHRQYQSPAHHLGITRMARNAWPGVHPGSSRDVLSGHVQLLQHEQRVRSPWLEGSWEVRVQWRDAGAAGAPSSQGDVALARCGDLETALVRLLTACTVMQRGIRCQGCVQPSDDF
jgi:hypothetical protein